ncbi:MAG: VOC family protein [Polyangiaceae bacterium]|nr:VOC family protein [Polyangiaceae bacterium]
MIEHVSIGVLDFERSGPFYDAVLEALGYVRLFGNARGIGYGVAGAKDEAFAILASGAEARAPGTGCHIAFRAPSREAVDAFHKAAIEKGAIDEGAPGPRPHYGPTYYAAFVRDLDGYRLEAVHI